MSGKGRTRTLVPTIYSRCLLPRQLSQSGEHRNRTPRVTAAPVFKTGCSPMSATLQAENCGPDPQGVTLRRVSSALLPQQVSSPCADSGIRTRTIQILSLSRLPVTSYPLGSPGEIRTHTSPDPKSGAFAILTTEPNKKASRLEEAFRNSPNFLLNTIPFEWFPSTNN